MRNEQSESRDRHLTPNLSPTHPVIRPEPLSSLQTTSPAYPERTARHQPPQGNDISVCLHPIRFLIRRWNDDFFLCRHRSSDALPSFIRSKTRPILPRQLLQSLRHFGMAALPRVVKGAAPERCKAGAKDDGRIEPVLIGHHTFSQARHADVEQWQNQPVGAAR